MNILFSFFRYALCIVILFVFFSCDKAPISYPHPNVVKPPAIGMQFIPSTLFSLAPFGYEKKEFFIEGLAYSYVNTIPLESDGKWQVAEAESREYKTRILVYRPVDPKDFNGTVIVEWLNVSGSADATPGWMNMHTEIMRRGYAWVGVSAQIVGVEGGESIMKSPITLPISLALKKIEPFRYGSLSHPGDSYSYDIYAQAARAVRHPQGTAPLGELKVERMIAMGQSQSASRLTTFINAFGTSTDLFDGYFIHSRLGSLPQFFWGSSAQLSEEPQQLIPTPEVVRYRDDLTVPILNLQTETDLFLFGAVTSRQEDNDYFRLWEVAGTAHNDLYIASSSMFDKGDKASIAELIGTEKSNIMLPSCAEFINSGPQHHFVANAALNTLNKWITKGIVPPSAPRFVLNEAGTGFVHDEYGNVIGGIRSPYVDVPIARLSGEKDFSDNIPISEITVCGISGQTEFFDDETILSLYPDHESYVKAVVNSVEDELDKGFLMPEDGKLIIEAAQTSDIP